ncbi:MAG: Alpha-D-kanosaminyltransferase [Syntrophorhabdus sp. PtaB.Bin027]|nr:MAG: Alpha-D-kanosaminyltransferase [Syntrophorhabdus sp. PtaB.Bin027]
MTIPIIFSKLLGKKIIYISAGSLKKRNDDNEIIRIIENSILKRINYQLSDKICLYSTRMADATFLLKYKSKIFISQEHIIDREKLFISNPINRRNLIVGYVGRFSSEKGIINLVESIKLINDIEKDVHFLIIGEGPLKPYIEEFSKNNHLIDVLEIHEWVDHDKLNYYYNQFKILVIPSYTEGLPNVMLEAIFSGTPVLATPVGSIPDYIQNNLTGFLLPDNSKESIATNILSVLHNPNLEKITENAYNSIKEKFILEDNIKQYAKVIDDLLVGN